MLRALSFQNSLENSTYDKDKEVLPQDEFDYGAEGSLTRSVSMHQSRECCFVCVCVCVCVCSHAYTHPHVRACARHYECALRAGICVRDKSSGKFIWLSAAADFRRYMARTDPPAPIRFLCK